MGVERHAGDVRVNARLAGVGAIAVPRVRAVGSAGSGIREGVGIAAGRSWEKGNRTNGTCGLGLWGGLGNTYKETVKMPEVGRWLFYPTFYGSKFPSFLCWFFFWLFFFFFFFFSSCYPLVKLTF